MKESEQGPGTSGQGTDRKISMRRARLAAIFSIEVEELDQGRLTEVNSLLLGDLAQRGVDVRQMVERDVADERAIDFVVAHAPVQPAEEQRELHEDGNCGEEDVRERETQERFLTSYGMTVL